MHLPVLWCLIHHPNKVAWKLVHGTIPDEKEVCHHCDVRRCVREAHLFLGTQTENMQDAVRKGRLRRRERHWTTYAPEKISHGEAHYLAKLTEVQVLEIRGLYATGDYSDSLLGSMYSVGRKTAHNAAIGRTWKHI